MVKPSINPDGGLKKEKGKECGLAAFAVIPLACEEPLQKPDPVDVVTIPIRRKAKLGLCFCISTVVVVVLVLGVGMALFFGHGSRYSFRCGVTYKDYEDYPIDDSNMGMQVGQGSVDEDIEVDTANHYERIEIPEQDEVERLTILHDFTVNMTAYRLWRSKVCYITWLDMDIVMSPSEFIRRAQENPDFLSEHYESVYESYRAVLPELELLDYGFGDYIPLLCQLVDTYWIEKIPADELADWEEFWRHYDEVELEPNDDDDDETMPDEPPRPRHRRAAKADEEVKSLGTEVTSLGTEVTSFAGTVVQKYKIYSAKAVQLKKDLEKLGA